MKLSRYVGTILLVCLGILGCQEIEGECWPVSEDGVGAGVGGGPVVPGSGGYGEQPPEPQSDTDPPPPDCSRVEDSACNERCITHYENAAANCGRITDEGERNICNDTAYVRYKSCRETCAQKQDDPVEKCKQVCDAQYEECCKPCNTKSCYAACMDVYKKCLKNCE